MDFRKLILIASTMVSAPAWAQYGGTFQHAVIRVEDCDQYTDPLSAFRDLFIKANVNGNLDPHGRMDGRGNLLEMQQELGLSDAEVKQLRSSTGYVSCVNKRTGQRQTGSGILVGTNMQVLTAAHGFKSNGKMFELTDCVFQNQEVPSVTIPLDLSVAEIGDSSNPPLPGDKDYAVIKLKSPVPNAVPFEIDTKKVQLNEWHISVSAHGLAVDREFDPFQPVAQQCMVFKSFGVSPRQYSTDCDSSPMSSGGGLYTRVSGRLAVAAILSYTGNGTFDNPSRKNLDGVPYNPAVQSTTEFVGVDGIVEDAIKKVTESIPSNTKGLLRPSTKAPGDLTI